MAGEVSSKESGGWEGSGHWAQGQTQPGQGHSRHSSGFWALLLKGRTSPPKEEQESPSNNETGGAVLYRALVPDMLGDLPLLLPPLTADASWSHQYPVWQQHLGEACGWPWKPGPVGCVDPPTGQCGHHHLPLLYHEGTLPCTPNPLSFCPFSTGNPQFA